MLNIKVVKKLLLFFLIFFSSSIFGQIYDEIEKEAVNIFLLNYDNSSKNISETIKGLENLKEVLFTKNSETIDLEELKNEFTQFERLSEIISVDSALFLFNLWYLKFNNTFYDYKKEEFFNSHKTKILLFSTSMSCHCTLEMCKDQTIEILILSGTTIKNMTTG